MLDASMLLTPEQEVDERFEYIQIGLASPQRIRSWSRGAVTKPETINYRTLRPERDGLFCERIFGPAKDWECHCGKYKRVRHRGIVCERCGVEVTDSKVRRHRMGHIELAAPVVHVWYLKGIPSYLSLLLDIPLRQLEDVIYFNVYVVLDPGTVEGLHRNQILSEEEYENLMADPEKKFRADMGAGAIRELLNNLKLRELSVDLRKEMAESAGQKKAKVIKRLRIVEAFINAGAHPSWIVLDTVPVIPPDLRPMVQLDGGRFATSDLNDLYRRVINRNNRLFRLMEMEAPDIIVRNEMRMLQEAVDALIDNGRRGRAVVGQNSRALKSLSDIIEGKQGRFRQNLLGKRVDYSGRSVIVVGPKLKLHQCGLPKEMALELFKPFVMNKLVERAIVQNIKSAKKKIERQETVVWDILEEVIKGHPVLLNRAPTLHRLGIQAFEPVLVEGRAIQLHPLVCVAFNADFDGDQMAVHVPLSVEAQTEARLLMLSTHNVLLPATGKPVITPTQDMILGIYYLTLERPIKTVKHVGGKITRIEHDVLYGTHRIYVKTAHGETEYEIPAAYKLEKQEGNQVEPGDVLATFPEYAGLPFNSITEALAAYYQGAILLHTKVKVRIPATKGVIPQEPEVTEAEVKTGRVSQYKIVTTTAGRLLFNEVLPPEFPLVNQTMDKPAVERIISQAFARLGSTRTAELADQLKNLGFRFATQGGISIAIEDLEVPAGKKDILARADEEIEKSHRRYLRGEITEVERYNKVIDTWSEATELLTSLIKSDYDRMNSVYMMAFSGARGNISQVRQLVGMRGLMSDPSGRIIGLPIKSNFREGLNVTEYIISSYGARKGIVDTALRTADSGYLTRRLADVAQDVIITDDDCGTTEGIFVQTLGEGDNITVSMADRLVGRYAAEPVSHPETGQTLVEAHTAIPRELAEKLQAQGVKQVKIRSALTCNSAWGICRVCYGWGLTTNALVETGEAIGIIAAQSIGEPGTQLTMRTFHTGGVFQASSRNVVKAQQAGTVKLDKLQTREYRTRHGEDTLLVEKEGVASIQTPKKAHNYTIPQGYELRVANGDTVKAGTILAEAGPYANVGQRRIIEKGYKEIVSDLSGAVRFIGFKPEEKKDRQGNVTKIANKNGVVWVLDGEVYSLPLSAQLLVKAGQRVQIDDIIAKMQIASEYGGRVQLSQDGREVQIITAQLVCPTVEVAQAKRETILRIHDEKSPIKTMHLLVSEGSRVETTGSALAEAVDERYIVPTGGEIRYLDCEVNDKGVVTGVCKLLFIPEETIALGPNDVPIVTRNQFVEADTEVIPGLNVKSSGYLQAEDADISQQMLFYPNAEVHVFPLETEVLVQAGTMVKKGAALTDGAHAKQAGLIEIIATETERTVIIRSVQEYKIEPVKKFIDYERNNDQLDLIPLTRLAVRNGERVRAGAPLVKINLMLTLQSLATTLGCKVEFARDEKENMTILRLSVVEMLSLRRGGIYEESFKGYRGLRSTTNLKVQEGQEIQPKTVIAETEYRTTVSGEVEVKATLGEINKMLIITEDHMVKMTLPPGAYVEPGQLIYEGDELAPGVIAPEACIVHKVGSIGAGGKAAPKSKSKTAKLKAPEGDGGPQEVTLRRARPYLVNQGTQILVDTDGMVSRGETLAILVFDQVKTGDIIQGLPRVEELLEARKPKESAVVSKYEGTVELETDSDDNQRVYIRDADGKRDEVTLPIGSRPIVQHGEHVKKGQPLIDGAINPHDILELLGLQEAQQLLVDSVQSVYRSQGVDIADKHIETIVRQMTRKVRVDDPGDSIYLQGEQIEKRDWEEENRRLEEEGKQLITAKPVLLGITKASLNTESFISAASFQETTRVLTEAAINGKKDYLRGLKENVIIGRLIPAGTGMPFNMQEAGVV